MRLPQIVSAGTFTMTNSGEGAVAFAYKEGGQVHCRVMLSNETRVLHGMRLAYVETVRTSWMRCRRDWRDIIKGSVASVENFVLEAERCG